MNKKIALFVAGLVLSASAYSIAPIWYALGASLTAHFGIIYSYFTSTAQTSPQAGGKAITVTFISSDDPAIAQQAVEDHEALPSGTDMPVYSGEFTFTFTNGSKSYTATGDTFSGLKQSLAKCPSDVCTAASTSGGSFYESSSGTSGAAYAARNIANATNFESQDVFYNGKPYHRVRVDVNGYNHFLYFKVPTVSCRPGYTYNTASGKCDLSNIESAQASGGDRVCPVVGGLPDTSDPDCVVLQADNKLTTSTSSDGRPAVSVRDRSGAVVSQVVDPATRASTVSQLFPTADGGYRREDTSVAGNGAVGPTSIVNTPSSPPPVYPGDPGGTTVPGSSTGSGTTSVPCGGPGQAKCSIDGMSDLIKKTTSVDSTLKDISDKLSGDGESPSEGLGEGLPSPITDSLDSLEHSASVIPVSSYCPADIFSFTLPLPSIAGGDYQLSDQGLFCDLMADYQEVIRMLSIACGFIAATFIVLRA